MTNRRRNGPRLAGDQIGGLDGDVGPGDGELHTLVLPDRPVEDHPLLGVIAGMLDEPTAVADAFGGDQDPLGVQAVEEVAEPAPLLADPILRGDPEIADRHRVGVIIHHHADRFGTRRAFASRRSTRNSESPRVFSPGGDAEVRGGGA